MAEVANGWLLVDEITTISRAAATPRIAGLSGLACKGITEIDCGSSGRIICPRCESRPMVPASSFEESVGRDSRK